MPEDLEKKKSSQMSQTSQTSQISSEEKIIEVVSSLFSRLERNMKLLEGRIEKIEKAFSEAETNESIPSQPIPGQPLPGQSVPNQPVPNQPVPNQPVPNQPVPNQPVPNQPVINDSIEKTLNLDNPLIQLVLSKIIGDETPKSDDSVLAKALEFAAKFNEVYRAGQQDTINLMKVLMTGKKEVFHE